MEAATGAERNDQFGPVRPVHRSATGLSPEGHPSSGFSLQPYYQKIKAENAGLKMDKTLLIASMVEEEAAHSSAHS